VGRRRAGMALPGALRVVPGPDAQRDLRGLRVRSSAPRTVVPHLCRAAAVRGRLPVLPAPPAGTRRGLDTLRLRLAAQPPAAGLQEWRPPAAGTAARIPAVCASSGGRNRRDRPGSPGSAARPAPRAARLQSVRGPCAGTVPAAWPASRHPQRQPGDRHSQPAGSEPPARKANLRGAFAASADLSGQRVLLLDDVMTTGTTLNELARVVRHTGAAQVTAVALARA
jgi:hypothetical protein